MGLESILHFCIVIKKNILMTNIIITVMLFFSSLFYSLTEGTSEPPKEKKVEINRISVAVNSGEELKTIDWEELKTLFDQTAVEKNIALNFEMKLNEKNPNHLKSTFAVKGVAKDLDHIISKAQKGVNSLIIISNKYKNI